MPQISTGGSKTHKTPKPPKPPAPPTPSAAHNAGAGSQSGVSNYGSSAPAPSAKKNAGAGATPGVQHYGENAPTPSAKRNAGAGSNPNVGTTNKGGRTNRQGVFTPRTDKSGNKGRPGHTSKGDGNQVGGLRGGGAGTDAGGVVRSGTRTGGTQSDQIPGRPPGSSGYTFNHNTGFGTRPDGPVLSFGSGAEGGGGGGGGAAGANPISGGTSLQGLTVDDVTKFGAKETKKQRLRSKGVVKTKAY